MVMDVAGVRYKEHDVGAVSFDTETGLGAFEYELRFVREGIELSPMTLIGFGPTVRPSGCNPDEK